MQDTFCSQLPIFRHLLSRLRQKNKRENRKILPFAFLVKVHRFEPRMSGAMHRDMLVCAGQVNGADATAQQATALRQRYKAQKRTARRQSFFFVISHQISIITAFLAGTVICFPATQQTSSTSPGLTKICARVPSSACHAVV